MGNVKIEVLVEQVLTAMVSDDMSKHTIKLYKVRGYNRILDYFRERNIPFYSEEVIRDFISERRSLYEEGFISEERWSASRRCGELLIHYQKSRNIEMQPLPDWNYIHGALRTKPSDGQFEDPNNIFALVWNIKNELTKFGLTESYLGACTSNGFDPILREHIAAGITEYSTRLVDRLIADSYEKYKNGSKKHAPIYRAIRKIKAYIEEYLKNGEIEWRVLSRIGTRELTLFFNSVQDGYQKELQRSGNLMPATMKNLLLYSYRFMLTLEDNGYYDFNGVSLKATSDILLQMAFPLTSGVKQLLYASRVFLGFLYENKYTDADLKTAVPKLVAPWRKLHEGFTDAEIIELLNSVDLETPTGKRDYAILVLAAQTGLRAVDIANLKKSDIDWRNKEIRIVQHKTGNVLGLPLEPESGNAIADYLLNVRPECNSKAVFISARHPYRPLEAASLHTLVRSRIQKTSFAGTTKPWLGMHSFRRSLGKRMLEAGISVDELSQILGHADINSSKPYLGTDEIDLMECSISLSGIEKAGGSL